MVPQCGYAYIQINFYVTQLEFINFLLSVEKF